MMKLKGRHCLICNKPGGSGLTFVLRSLGYGRGTPGILYAHGNCVAAEQKKQAANPPAVVIVTVPPVFHTDRHERDLPVGETITKTSRGVTIRIPVEDAREYLNDAEHYSHPNGPDDCDRGVKASARASLAPLRAVLPQAPVNPNPKEPDA